MVANYNSAILRLHPQKLDHFLLLLLLLTPCVTPLTFHFPTFKQSDSGLLFTEGDAVISNQFIHMTKENLHAESRSVGRATYREPFLLRENATGKLADFTTSFAFIIDGRNRTSYGEGLAFFLAPNGSLLNRAPGKGSSLGLPVNSSLENVIEPSNDYPFVAVEFDTYRNSWPTVEDPDGDHVGIDVNRLKSNITRAWNGGVVEAKLNRAWIRYNSSSKNLSVAFTTFNNDTQEQRISDLSYMVDLNKYLPDRAIVGFSASTGANSALHKIISWNFTSTSLVDHESLALSGQEETKDETPVPEPGPTSKFKARKRKKPLAVVIGSSIGGFILVCFLGLGLYNSCKKKATRTTTDGNPNDLIHEFEGTSSLKIFPYEELVLATRDFFEGEKLGEGGSEVEIYKGYMTYLNSYVAVKKISRGAKHWIDLYAQQLRIISQCRHRNLVQLIGWCHEKGELLLVYEFVPNGSLETHLFKSESLLFWESRYRIVLGMASGLLYLHEGGRQPLLHTNIKPSNVMVDSNFNAKLRDFGLGHRREPQMITTSYTAPEYFIGPLRNKSDVFSFGIVALEISCGRKLIDPKFEGSQVDMVEWVWELYVEGKVIEAADPKLHGDFNDKQMECLLIVGLWCAHQDYILRPSMRQAFCALNFEDPLPILPSRMPMGTSPPATTLSRSPSTIGSEGGQMESGYGNATNCSEITESSAMESGYGNATNCSEIIESSAIESGNATNCSEITESSAIESGYGNATNSTEITESSAVESGYGNATNCSEITESLAVESGYSNATNCSEITESLAVESGYGNATYGNATNCSEITESSAVESGYGNATNCSEITESSAIESSYGNATNSSEITESSAVESGYSNATNSSKITESLAMESGYGNATNSSEITESSATNSHQQFRLGKE